MTFSVPLSSTIVTGILMVRSGSFSCQSEISGSPVTVPSGFTVKLRPTALAASLIVNGSFTVTAFVFAGTSARSFTFGVLTTYGTSR